MSFRSMAAKPPMAMNMSYREPAQPLPLERKTGPFEPPPLFQAYPQSMKDGTLELSTMSVEAALKSKSRRGPGLQAPTLENKAADGKSVSGLSSETRRTRTTMRHIANGSSTHVELPRKVFVLVTSGYLLQYAETGPSDRLPERLLHLGKDSAAFACDLVPGKHYVLQVSQAVDQEGVVIANSGSILSKLGIRTAAAKRMASSFLLVMPSAGEMESWMTTIRREIESFGGKKAVPDRTAPQHVADTGPKTDELETPIQSHRYQVKRHPSMVSHMTPSPRDTSPVLPSTSEVDNTEPEDGSTPEQLGEEALELEGEERQSVARMSEAPSARSSAVVSLDQQQLNNLRNSLRSSNRMSRASQAATVATTVGTSRTNSLTGSPPGSDRSLQTSMDAPQEGGASVKPMYRTMASYRRSVVPSPMSTELRSSPSLNTLSPRSRSSIVDGHSDVGRRPSLPHSTSPQKHLATARSAPDLQASLDSREKHDSKVPTPPPLPTPSPIAAAADSERPESFVGDLPSPFALSSSRTSIRRASTLEQLSDKVHPAHRTNPHRTSTMQQSPVRSPPALPVVDRTSDANATKRISFTMPLKVNPSGQHDATAVRNSRRISQINTPDKAGETPVTRTLTAKVEPSSHLSISHVHADRSSPQPERSPRSPYRSSSARLSLFPSQVSPNTPASIESPKRSPSAVTPGTYMQPQANGQALKRPNSMQVRFDRAPFLSSIRKSMTTSDTRTPPIRGMKPSRSASNVAALAKQSVPYEPSRALKDDTPALLEEADQATPLPDRSSSVSPLPPRPGSRSSVRRSVRASSSLPELDLGLPVVGLGPPAPPPSAPLPAPPSGSRPTSPTSMYAANTTSMDSVVGLGIRVA